jgi:hypothetical protein
VHHAHQRLDQRSRVHLGSNREKHILRIPLLRLRKEHAAGHRLCPRNILHIADHSDHRRRLIAPEIQSRADGSLRVLPELPGGGLVDQDDRRRVRAVARADVSTRAQRQTKRIDEAGGEEMVPGFRAFRFRKLPADDAERGVFVVAGPRQIAGQANGAHTGHRPHALGHTFEKRRHLLRFAIARRRQIDQRRERMVRTKARVKLRERAEAPQQQSAGDDEHERECDFHNNERTTQTLLRPAWGAAAAM